MDAALQAELGRIAQEMQLRRRQVESVFELFQAGATTFQITRYRKQHTDALPEDAVRHIERQLRQYHHLQERRAATVKLAEVKGKATEDFQKAVEAAITLSRLDDLSAALREKKYGFADSARAKGLEDFAGAVWEQREEVGDLEQMLAGLVDPDKGLASADDIVTEVAPLLAERMVDHADARTAGRRVIAAGKIVAKASGALPPPRGEAGAGEGHARPRPSGPSEFKAYVNFAEPLGSIAANKLLAINRGERLGALEVRLEFDHKEFEHAVHEALGVATHKHARLLEVAFPLVVQHLAAILEEEVRDEATSRAEEHAADVAGRTVRNLLLQPGVGAERVLAIDPGLKNGCRYAVVGEKGELLDFGVVYPFTARRKRKKKKKTAFTTEATVEQKVAEWEQSIAAAEGAPAPAAPEALANGQEGHDSPATEHHQTTPAEHHEAPRTPPPVLPADSFYRVTSASPEGNEDQNQAAAGEEPAPESPTATLDPTPPEEATPAVGEEAPPADGAAESNEVHDESDDGVEDHEDEDSPPRPAGAPPLPPRRERAKNLFADLVRKHNLSKAALGQGSGGREVEELLTELLKGGDANFGYAVLHEAAASAYASSVAGREELPDLDAGLRTAVSLGRRLQNPLKELVKVDPQQFGLGTAHHEIAGRVLRDRLIDAVGSVINDVGVDLNDCHPWLLQFVSGMNIVRARLVCDYGANNGPFKSREQLKQIEGITEEVFNQAAGFVYVRGGDEALDETRIHPESYPLARRILEKVGADANGLRDRDAWAATAQKLDALNAEALAKELGADVPTVWDTLEYLARPHADPRLEHPPILFKTGLRQFEDLKVGDELSGPILNIVDFGVFVDIGLKDCGLVHLSQMANRFVRSPHDVATVGDIVRVWVLSIDQERKRVSLSMIPPGARQRGEGRPRRGGRHGDQPAGGPGEGRPPRQGGERGQGRPAGGRDFGRPPGVQRTDQPRTGGGPRQGGPRQNDRGGDRTREYNVRAKPKPLPELSRDALEGKSVLHGFGELKAFFEAKKPKSESRQETEPPSVPPPAEPEPVNPKPDAEAAPLTPDPGESG